MLRINLRVSRCEKGAFLSLFTIQVQFSATLRTELKCYHYTAVRKPTSSSFRSGFFGTVKSKNGETSDKLMIYDSLQRDSTEKKLNTAEGRRICPSGSFRASPPPVQLQYIDSFSSPLGLVTFSRFLLMMS